MILFIFIFLHKYALLLFRETSKFITNFLTKKCYIITYWLNVKILTFSAYVVRYTKVKRNILILCYKVLNS